jgi:hypothetical protein
MEIILLLLRRRYGYAGVAPEDWETDDYKLPGEMDSQRTQDGVPGITCKLHHKRNWRYLDNPIQMTEDPFISCLFKLILFFEVFRRLILISLHFLYCYFDSRSNVS